MLVTRRLLLLRAVTLLGDLHLAVAGAVLLLVHPEELLGNMLP